MNKFKILLLFLGVSLVGYSQSPITVKQGDSFTALLVFDNAYDVNRLQDISVSINRQEVARKSTGGIVATNNVRAFRVPLSSTTMRRFQGSNTLEVAVDDSILGVRRIAPLTLIVSASQNAFSNGSVNTGIDATINMTISATSITTNTVLAQVMKGDKGDKGDPGSGGSGTSIDTTLYVRKVSGYQLSQNNYTTAEKSKLSGIASGATANSTDAQLRDRSTHTGTQAQSTVTNLVSDLAAKLNIADTTVLLRKTTAAGLYQPKGSYLTSINSSQVTTALGFTPYNATNPSGYITSSALSPYLTTSSATSTYQPILVSGTTIKTINGASLLGSGNIVISGGGSAIDTTLFLQKTTAAGLYQPKGSYLTSATAASTYQPIGSYLVSGDLAAYLPKSDTTLYVRKVSGYQLSQSNYTSAEKSKLSGIASGAEVNVNADWNAVSGDAQILNKPTLGTASALNVAATGNAATGEVVKGNDTRLSDARTPTTHNHTASNITDFDAAVAANSAVAANTAKVTNATHTGDVTGSTTLTYNNVLPANKGGAGSVSGILKADGSGTVSAATAGTDYVIPSGNITGTSGGLSVDIAQSRVTNLVSDLAAKLNIADTTVLLRKTTAAGLYQLKGRYGHLDSANIWRGSQTFGGTPTPTHSITLPSTSTGFAHYNTTDQTTNFERVRSYWSGNNYFFGSEKGGTGTVRGFGFVTNGVEQGRLFSTGNWFLGSSPVDAGLKLDVNGSARVQGNLDVNSGSGTNTITLRDAVISKAAGSGFSFSSVVFSSSSVSSPVAYFGTGASSISNTPAVSAVVELASNTRGFLPPRMTTAQRDAIASPATGLELYNTTANTKDIHDGTAWRSLATTAHVTTAISTKADIASPTFTGVPLAPTATAGTNTTQIATTAYVEDAKNKTLESLEVAFDDETTAITTGNGKLTFYMPYAMTVTEVFLAVKTPQSSGAVFTVDINEEGVSILSTKLTLDNNETKSSTAATPAVVSDTSLAKWATMTIDVDQSSGIAIGGKIIINGYRQ